MPDASKSNDLAGQFDLVFIRLFYGSALNHQMFIIASKFS